MSGKPKSKLLINSTRNILCFVVFDGFCFLLLPKILLLAFSFFLILQFPSPQVAWIKIFGSKKKTSKTKNNILFRELFSRQPIEFKIFISISSIPGSSTLGSAGSDDVSFIVVWRNLLPTEAYQIQMQKHFCNNFKQLKIWISFFKIKTYILSSQTSWNKNATIKYFEDGI